MTSGEAFLAAIEAERDQARSERDALAREVRVLHAAINERDRVLAERPCASCASCAGCGSTDLQMFCRDCWGD